MGKVTDNLGYELKKIREESGITLKELCEEIGFEVAPYNLIENGKRTVKQEDMAEYLYYKVQKAVHKLQTDENRRYYTVSEDKHQKAMDYLERGYNIVKIAVNLEVDEDELRKHLRRNNVKFSEYKDSSIFR